MDGKLLTLRLELITESPLNPRRIFEPTALQELAASLKKSGVLEPLVVRRVKGRYELIAGARRLRAATLAKLPTVPVVVRDCTDREAIELMLVENLQRAELSPLDECEAFHRLQDQHDMSQADIGAAIGRSQVHVSWRMGLRRLIQEARVALTEGRIATSTAIELSRLEPKVQKRLMRVKGKNQMGFQVTQDQIRDALGKAPKRAPAPSGDVHALCKRRIKALEDQVRALQARRPVHDEEPSIEDLEELEQEFEETVDYPSGPVDEGRLKKAQLGEDLRLCRSCQTAVRGDPCPNCGKPEKESRAA